MKLITSRLPGDELQVTIQSCDGDLHVRGRVAWTRRKGFIFGRHEVGVEFIDVDDSVRRKLSRVASAHRETNVAA